MLETILTAPFIAGITLFIVGLSVAFKGVKDRDYKVFAFILSIVGYMLMKLTVRGVPYQVPSNWGVLTLELMFGVVSMVAGLGLLIHFVQNRSKEDWEIYLSAMVLIFGFIIAHSAATGFIYPVSVVSPMSFLDVSIPTNYVELTNILIIVNLAAGSILGWRLWSD